MKRKKNKGRNYRFGESVKPTSVSMPGTLRRIAQEHADSRGVSFSAVSYTHLTLPTTPYV